jgi:hypothetical protein
MTSVPEGAQISEDGNYWWDGTQWQLVAAASGSSPETSAPASGEAGTGGEASAADGIAAWGSDFEQWTQEQRDKFFTVIDHTQPPEGSGAVLGEPAEINEGTEVA